MKIVSSKEVYACGLFRVTEDEAVLPDKKDKTGGVFAAAWCAIAAPPS